MQVQIEALEQVLEVENTIATAFEDFDLVIEAFDKTTVFSQDEVVSDLLPPGGQQLQEIVKTRQATFLDVLDPTLDFGLGLFLGEGHVKNSRELFPQHIGLFCQWR